MNAPDDIVADAGAKNPLSETMLAMDVANMLRREPTLDGPDAAARLAATYESIGMSVPETALQDGVAAHRDRRFAYTGAKPGFAATLAGIYVGRRRWLPATTAIVLMLVIALGGYFLVYKPYRDGQAERARVELAETLPAEMDSLYGTIFEETKVQQASNDAAGIRDRGKAAAQQGDRDGAEAAVADLTNIRDTLRQEYRLTVVDRPDAKWGFWTFPKDNTDATNYYLVVEALDPDGKALSLPIPDEQTGKTETVSLWGIRVPENVYRAVEADKADDGQIQHTLVGVKDFGFLEPAFVVDVLGGTVTRW